ncbi:MAG: ABC transporter permease [Defluviitaleaceae bacterium]|nr:ABC transporter permease [Defluviitaleaceae bacterium]
MKKLLKNSNFLIGFILILILFIVSMLSFFYTPHSPTEMNAEFRFSSPNLMFLFGTDNFGRDILSRIMIGLRTGFLVGALSTLIGFTIGVSLGAISGYLGKGLDLAFSRLVEIIMTFPTVLFALMLISVLGAGLFNTILVLGVASVPRFFRLTRAGVLQQKNLQYVKAAKMRGCGAFRIMFIHILPNILAPLIVNISFSFSMSVMAEAGLSYLGLGVNPPHPSLGRMLQEAQPHLSRSPWYVGFTGLMIVIMVLGFNLMGDGINEEFNKR